MKKLAAGIMLGILISSLIYIPLLVHERKEKFEYEKLHGHTDGLLFVANLIKEEFSSGGTSTNGGDGGLIEHTPAEPVVTQGGSGGDLGATGDNGFGDIDSGSGAGPGAAIVKNGHVLTIDLNGTILGTVS